MPFAKALFRRDEGRATGQNGDIVANGRKADFLATSGTRDAVVDGRVGSTELYAEDRFHARLVSAGHQLSTMLLLASQLFDELADEFRLVVDRTDRLKGRIDKLSNAIDRLDAKAAEIPEGTLSAVAQTSRLFETDYVLRGLSIFDPSNRPLSIQALYSQASPTPVAHFRECDSYRTDDIRGAQIFSRIPVALNKWTDLFLVGKAKHRTIFPTKHHRIRPLQVAFETRSLPDILSSGAAEVTKENKDGGNKTETRTDFFPHESFFALSTEVQPVLLVDIDVTGSSFNQLCKLHAPTHPHEDLDKSCSTASLGRYKKVMKRPKTVSGISDLVFREIDFEPVALKHSNSTKVRSSSRNLLNKTKSQTLEIYAPKERKNSQKKKVGKCFEEEEESKSCTSWRHSLKSVFRLSRSKSRDLWNTRGVEETAKDSENHMFALKRSVSLPRSLKSSTKHSTVAFGSFRSSSVEGRLNFRVAQADKVSAVSSAGISKSPKPVAGERLGRSLTKSFSQIRLSHSSKSQRNFDIPGRPQSMEIRMPSLDEDGRPVLSLYSNNVSISNALSSNTATSSSISDHSWAKSLSTVRLRCHDGKDHKDDCQSSSGRWSGSSGMTERQVLLDSERQMESTFAVQSPSETSFSTKDSAMCLHFNPSESSPLDRTSSNAISMSHPKSVLSPTAAVNSDQIKTVNTENKVSRSSITFGLINKAPSANGNKSAQESPINNFNDSDEDIFPNKPLNNRPSFNRATKIESSSKPKSSYRSSLMLKLKKFGKSSKSGAPSVCPEQLPNPVKIPTMGDFTLEEASRLTPTLPHGESSELKKLAELADKLATAKATNNAASPLSSSSFSSPSSGSSVAWSKLHSPQPLIIGEVNRILQRSALSVNPLSSPNDKSKYESSDHVTGSSHFFPHDVNCCQKSDDQTTGPGSPTITDQPNSPSKLDQCSISKGQKITELESILETSHDCETALPYMVMNKTVPFASDFDSFDVGDLSDRSEQFPPTRGDSTYSKNGDILQTQARVVTPVTEVLGAVEEKNDQRENENKDGSNVGSNRFSPTSANNRPNVLLLSPLLDGSADGLVPATARLIISSPVATQACFVNNPHKRSLCQPVSPEDFAKFCSGELEMVQSPSNNFNHFIYPETVASKKTSDFTKHLSGFSTTIREQVDPSNYGRSWYDGISCEQFTPVATINKANMVAVSSQSYIPPLVHSASTDGAVMPYNFKPINQRLAATNNNQTVLTFQTAENNFYPFATSSPSRKLVDVDRPSIRTNIFRASLTNVTKTTKPLEKKCARVVFPSADAGYLHPAPSLQHTSSMCGNSRQNRPAASIDETPPSSAEQFQLKTFASNTTAEGKRGQNWAVPRNGGTLNFNSSVPCDSTLIKSNTLPRSYGTVFEKPFLHRPNAEFASDQ